MNLDISLYTVLVIGIILIVLVIVKNQLKLAQLRRYEEVFIGMDEDEMLEIMGKGYNTSSLKNNRKKYEWRINSKSYGSSANGVSTRTYTGVKKVDIYVKDGIVEEIKPLNVH